MPPAVQLKATWFEEAFDASPLLEVVRKYEPTALLQAISHADRMPTHAQVELLLAACAKSESGSRTQVEEPDLRLVFAEAQRLIDAQDERMGPTMRALRIIRGIRPAWFTAPLYAEVLQPFSELCREHVGETPQELFDAATRLGDRAVEPALSLSNILLEETSVHLKDVRTPSDLRGAAFAVLPSGQRILLGYNAAEAFYRGINRILRRKSKGFGNRKGKSLESFVMRRLQRLAPSWTFHRSSFITGKEKDIIGWDDESGIAVECKSVAVRQESADWSSRNLAADVAYIREALDQVQPSLALLRQGGNLDDATPVPARNYVQGMVITDEEFTSYLRAGLDGFRLEFQGSDDTNWHGRHVWVANFLDLEHHTQTCGSISVLLDYLRYRSHPSLRGFDEPEAWSAYTMTQTHYGLHQGVQVVVREANWKIRRERGLTRFRPEWLTRLAAIQIMDQRRCSQRAVRLIQQDLHNARLRFAREIREHSVDSEYGGKALANLARKLLEDQEEMDSNLYDPTLTSM